MRSVVRTGPLRLRVVTPWVDLNISEENETWGAREEAEIRLLKAERALILDMVMMMIGDTLVIS